MKKSQAVTAEIEVADQSTKLPFCGIIMPIAPMGQYEKSHWDRVRIVLNEAIEQAGYTPRLVSESEDIGIIHARIVQNLYDDPIVVCDVSGKNANVMFELGLRLAFDKPTIVIKDDLTDYSFDTSPIEHISYRADLRFDDVREFSKRLAAAITGSVAKKTKDEKYSPFLGHFHRVKVTELETAEIGSQQFLLDQMATLQKEIYRLANKMDAAKKETGNDFLTDYLLRKNTPNKDELTNRLTNMILGIKEKPDYDFVDILGAKSG